MKKRLIGMLAALSVASLTLMAGAASGLTLVVDHASGVAGSSGHVDVYLQRDAGDSSSLSLAGFQAAVFLVGSPSGVSFDVPYALTTIGPAHPQLISDNFTPNFGFDNTAHRASAFAFLNSGAALIADGAGLFRVAYSIDPGTAVQVFDIGVDLAPFSGTVLSDENSLAIPFSVSPGSISVVPEPSTGLLLGLGLVAFASGRRKSAPPLR